MRGERVLGRRTVPEGEGEVPSTDGTLLENPGSVVLDPAPPPVSPQIVSEARLGAADLVRLGRLTPPRTTLTAFVDHDLYQRIQMHHEGGISGFINDAIEDLAETMDIVALLMSEKELADRRAGQSTTTIGARVPFPMVQHVTALVDRARRAGIPGVTKNAIVSGLVFRYAEMTGLLRDDLDHPDAE